MKIVRVFVAILVILIISFLFFLKPFFSPVEAQISVTSFDLTDSVAPAGALAQGVSDVVFVPDGQNPQEGIYRFSFTPTGASSPTEVYEIDTADINVRKGLLRIKEAVRNFYPIYDGGTKMRVDSAILNPSQIAQTAANVQFSHQLAGKIVIFTISEDVTSSSGTQTFSKTYVFELKGRSLVMRVMQNNAPAFLQFNTFYRGFTFNCGLQTSNAVPVTVPYMEIAPIIKAGSAGNEYFYSTYFDYAKSGSNGAPSFIGFSSCGTNSYRFGYETAYTNSEAGPNGVRVPVLDETAYITVSSDIDDALMHIHKTPTAGRTLLNDYFIVDLWRTRSDVQLAGSSVFEKSASLLQDLSNFGMDKIFVNYHQWSMLRRDCGYPNFFPANSGPVSSTNSFSYGGSAGMHNLANTAVGLGYLFGLDISFDMMHQNSLYYNSNSLAQNPAGGFIISWIGGNWCLGFEQGYLMAADKNMQYAQAEAVVAQAENYNVNGIYIDVTPSKSLHSTIDFNYDNPNAFTMKDVFNYLNALHLFQKNNFANNGPISGEGHKTEYSSQNYFAGVVETNEGEIKGGENALVIPDFTLKHRKHAALLQGMGLDGRWVCPACVNNPWQIDYLHPTYSAPTFPAGQQNINQDKYDATTIAFGNTGYFSEATYGASSSPTSQNYVGVPSPTLNDFYNLIVRRFYKFRDLQPQYLGSDVVDILYLNSQGGFIDLTDAIKQGVSFANPKLKITYQSGLEILINREQAGVWQVTAQDGVTYYIPSNGFAATNPSINFVEYTALVDSNNNPSATGTRVDFVKSNNYVFVNPRGVLVNFGNHFGQNVVTDKIKAVRPNGWSLEEQGDGSFAVFTSGCFSNCPPNAPSELTASLA